MSIIKAPGLRRGLARSVAFAAVLLAGSAGLSRAESDAARDAVETPAYGLITTIAVPGQPLTGFDISYVDHRLPLYYLADRANAALDIFDAAGNRFLTRVGGFAGIAHNPNGTANNDISGPDGVVPVGVGEVWVGDGDSSVKVINIFTQSIVATISTVRPGSTAAADKRADEMAYDPRDHILVVANNAATPPFISFISTDPANRRVLGRIEFADYAGVEQSVYNPGTGLFYVNLTARNDNANLGGVAVVDPRTMSVRQVFPLTGCNPAGAALGPRQELLIGCSLTANSQIISARDGTLLATLPQVSGSDEVWYNPGDGNYYLAARNNPAAAGGPSLGIVNARTRRFVINVASDASAHSVAADARSNHVFVPLGPNTTVPNCSTGCIGVYGNTDSDAASDLRESRASWWSEAGRRDAD